MESNKANHWYILFVRGGFEKQIINNIYNSLKNQKLEKQVTEIKILDGYNNKTGKIKNLLSSYLFVSCWLMNKELLTVFYSVSGVISFLNHDKNDLSKNPSALSALEAKNLLLIGKRKESNSNHWNKNQEQQNFKNNKLIFEIGDLIIIREGFFKDYRGSVVKVDLKKEILTINVDFFGRLTPVNIKFIECEKI